jgi:hypothetical protein
MTVQQPDIQWYIARDGKQHGPLSDVEMRTFVGQGHLRPTDLIWRPGFADWRPAPAVFPFQAPEAPRPPPPQQQQFHTPPTGHARQSVFVPDHSFESDFRDQEQGGSWTKRIAGIALLLLLLGGGGAGAWYFLNKSGPKTETHPEAIDQSALRSEPLSASAPEQAAPEQQAQPAGPAPNGAANGTAMNGIQTVAPQVTAPPVSPEVLQKVSADLDRKFQQSAMWNVVKREFPDWYGAQIQDAAKLAAQNQPEPEIAKRLAQALVELRRKHAEQALAASTDKLKVIANAFLDNLKNLSERSIGACYGFISQGETSPAVAELMLSPQDGKAIQAQVTAIFEAISDGRKTPKPHDRAGKADYEVLVAQLTKLGWKENDLKTFSNPTALSHEPPGRVCQMVQDWFVAHLAVQDKGAQERLLVETLKPVVSG